jgi:hypothetical protein
MKEKTARHFLVAYGLAAIALGVYTLLNLKTANSQLGSILVALGAIIGGISMLLRSRRSNPSA